MSPRLFTPSVSRITTFDLALLSFRRLTALASPIPSAVPSSIIPRCTMSQLTLWNKFNSTPWSTVSGHCVNASPAKIVRPILSFGRPLINSAATCLAASIRFGFKSSASILVDTSTASMMSIPSISVFCQLSVVCGRASTSTIITNVRIRSTNGACSK